MNELPDGLDLVLEPFARIAIAGGPRSGKSTLAERIRGDRELIATDAFRELPWGDVPAAVIARCAPLDRFVIEGVQVARALRKGLAVDAIIWLPKALAPLTKGQAAMAKGVHTVLDGWLADSAPKPTLHVLHL